MNMPRADTTLWDVTQSGAPMGARFLAAKDVLIALRDLQRFSALGEDIDKFRNKSVLIHARSQLYVALALIELDGIARRLILCTPDVTGDLLGEVAAEGKVDILLSDTSQETALSGLQKAQFGIVPLDAGRTILRNIASEWLFLTSGTTGRPKQVIHTLSSLAAPLENGGAALPKTVWTSFYDIRRYGGMQLFLRALYSGGSMIFSSPQEPFASFLQRVGAGGVTHISGTPSHWRYALMSGAANKISPAYIRLSGEVVDQGILDKLHETFPQARVVHAFASTEAGIAFDVRDGLAGFPANLLEQPDSPVALKIKNGTLHVRSSRTAMKYTREGLALLDEEGFVDTGDLVELHDNRYHFVGRREGVINIGGLKVYPEEIEAVLNRHPAVQMSLVRDRRNPITGALVVADIVIKPSYLADGSSFPAIRNELLATCRKTLAPHKVPTTLREVPFLKITASGKLARLHG
jgi:acyl-CoA synthetase (AMP-forming)/AMP-acid ligase II